jgi:hypothetical protein
MVTAILLSSLTLAATPTAEFTAPPQNPVVKVWLNKKGNVKQGDRVRVYTRAEADGYLLVLHAEPDGRIRVLFPLDPYHDNFVRGGQDYELRGRGDREAFRVYETGGMGSVFAAFSRDPYQFGEFVRGDHWDYRILDQWRLTEDLDPETELLALARAMAGPVSFEYDLVHYPVGSQVAYYGGGGATYVSLGYYPSSYWGISFGWGYPSYWGSYWYGPSWWGYYPYYPAHYYRPYYYWGYPYYYYPYGYAYYPYYSYPCSGCYYPGGGYWYGHPQSPSGTTYRGRYAWKDNGRYDMARGGIDTRRRTAPSSGNRLHSDLGSRYAVEQGGRRSAPTVVNTAGRRVSPTADRATGRQVSPGTTSTAGRRTVATPTTAGRGIPEATRTETGRRVEPSGWGITDGRRTVTPAARPAPTGTQSQPDAAGRRAVTPDRSTPQRQTEPASRRVTPSRSETTNRPSTPTRSVLPSRPSSSSGSTAPVRRTTPTLERRATPSRSSSPSARPSTPSRSTPSPSATRRPSAPTRSAPSPSANRRPSTPSRPQVSRPSAPSRAPSASRAPSPSRPSAPSRRPSSGRRKN